MNCNAWRATPAAASRLLSILGVSVFIALTHAGTANTTNLQSHSSASIPPSSGASNNLRAVSDVVAGEMELAALGTTLTNNIRELATKTDAVQTAFQRHQVAFGIFSGLLVLLVLLIRFGKRIIGYEARGLG